MALEYVDRQSTTYSGRLSVHSVKSATAKQLLFITLGIVCCCPLPRRTHFIVQPQTPPKLPFPCTPSSFQKQRKHPTFYCLSTGNRVCMCGLGIFLPKSHRRKGHTIAYRIATLNRYRRLEKRSFGTGVYFCGFIRPSQCNVTNKTYTKRKQPVTAVLILFSK